MLTLGDGTQVATQGNPTDDWRRWVKAMRRPDLNDDPRFARYTARLEHREELCAIILDFARSFDTFEALYERVDPQRIAVGVVRSVSDLAATDWAQERGLVAEPEPGLRFPRVPYRSSSGEVGATSRGPKRGEHNESGLRELDGIDDDTLDALRARGALLSAEDGKH